MIALVLLILTIWIGYKSIISINKIFYQLLSIILCGVWLVYTLYMHSYWMAIFWVIMMALDTKTYQRYKNEQKKD